MQLCNSSLHIHGQRRGVLNYCQGCNEVRWRPGQEVSLAPPFSNLRSFGSKCTALKCLWHCWDFSAPPAVIRRPHSDSVHATCPNISGRFSWNFLNLARIFPLPRMPIALTQKLWQNTSYLQLGRLNNWFFAVMTIPAQHLNICSPKLGECDGCVVLILLLQLQTRRQLTLAMKRQIWHG